MGSKRVDCIPHPLLGARQLWASCPSSLWLRVSSPDGVRMRTRRERAGLGRHPVSTPSSGSTPPSSTLSSGGWFLKQTGLTCPSPQAPAAGTHPGRRREGLALTYPGLQNAGVGSGWRVHALPRPSEKGALWSGHIPGQRPGLLTLSVPWAEARGQGWGDSQWTSVPAHKGPLWPSSWLPYSGPQSPTRLAPRSSVRHVPEAQSRQCCPHKHPLLV